MDFAEKNSINLHYCYYCTLLTEMDSKNKLADFEQFSNGSFQDKISEQNVNEIYRWKLRE
jgi:hypothetical protein